MRRGAYTPDTSTAPPCDAQYELNLKTRQILRSILKKKTYSSGCVFW